MRRTIPFLVVISLAVFACATSAEEAPTPKVAWDQAKVTALADELKKATDELYNQYYAFTGGGSGLSPVMGGPGGQGFELTDTLRRVRQEALVLDAHLKKGDGYERTLGLWKFMMEHVRDAQVNYARTFEAEQVAGPWKQVQSIIDQMAPYYGGRNPKG